MDRFKLLLAARPPGRQMFCNSAKLPSGMWACYNSRQYIIWALRFQGPWNVFREISHVSWVGCHQAEVLLLLHRHSPTDSKKTSNCTHKSHASSQFIICSITVMCWCQSAVQNTISKFKLGDVTQSGKNMYFQRIISLFFIFWATIPYFFLPFSRD